MDFTPNVDLYKPNKKDEVEVVTSLSENFTKIDTEFGSVREELADIVTLKTNGVDDTAAFQNAVNSAKTIRLLNKTYIITAPIVISNPVKILGAFSSESGSDSVIQKKENIDGIRIEARGVVIENLRIVSTNTSLETSGSGIVIGKAGVMAQNTVLKNVMVSSCFDGITLVNGNNCDLNFSVLQNRNFGYNVNPSAELNFSGNTIRCINAYGNRVGVVVSGEGSEFYIVSQSNTDDNIQLAGFCNNNKIVGYTEYAVNGYEINANGNAYANVIIGTYRNANPLKVYTSATGFPNHLLFSWDINNAPTGSNVNGVINTLFSNQYHFMTNGFTGIPESKGYLFVDYVNDNKLKFKDANGVIKIVNLT